MLGAFPLNLAGCAQATLGERDVSDSQSPGLHKPCVLLSPSPGQLPLHQDSERGQAQHLPQMSSPDIVILASAGPLAAFFSGLVRNALSVHQ